MSSSKLPSLRKRVLQLIEILTELASPDPALQARASEEIRKLPIGFFEDFGVPNKGLKALEKDAPTLIQRTEDPRVLEILISFLADSPRALPSILPTLAAKLRTAEDGVAQAIVYAFGNAKKASAPYLPEMLKLYDHPNHEVRWRVAWAYSKIRPLSQDHLRYFERWIADSYNTTRLYAAIILSEAVDAIPSARKLLKTIENDPDSGVAHYAREGLK